jgi:serine phosphatase RsbU (regulator of sigma subunit)
MAVVIADVTGHGIGSAMLMAVCRAYARASVPNMDPLRAAIVQLNRLVSHDFGDGRFVTFAVALLSPNHDVIELLSAGHGPTLVCRRAGGAIESFAGDGVPLGIVPEEEFTEPRRVRMAVGDTLLMVTDGFMEAHNSAGDLFGISRLSVALTTHSEGPISEIVTRIDSEVRAFAGTQPQADDMTAVVIRRAT